MIRTILAATLVAATLTFGLGYASASDLPASQPTKETTASKWGCTIAQRISQGLLYDTPGFFGNKNWSSNTFVGCAQQGGGFDWDVVVNAPFRDFGFANEVDAEGGYTFVLGNFSTRVGVGYWNFEPSPGKRFQIADFRVQASYKFDLAKDISLTPWVRLEDQELFAPSIARDRDTNVAFGADFAASIGDIATIIVQAQHTYHVKSFGPAQNVTAVTAELPFNIGTFNNAKMTVGPWYRMTFGNILGAPGNHEFNNSFGAKFTANW